VWELSQCTVWRKDKRLMIVQTNRRDGKAVREKGGKEIKIIKVIKRKEKEKLFCCVL
jgi:hypothetical protein